MDDDAFVRIEWRETEEQASASRGLAREWRARSLIWMAAACGLGALSAALAGSICAGLAIVGPLVFFVYGLLAAYWRIRSEVDRRRVRAWIATAQVKRAETFRDPALEVRDDRGGLRTVRIDVQGLDMSNAGQGYAAFPWAAISGVWALSSGHVLFLGRGSLALFVPAWAFEAVGQRQEFVEQARAWRNAASKLLTAPREAPSLEHSTESFTLSVRATIDLARAQPRRIPLWASVPATGAVLVLAIQVSSLLPPMYSLTSFDYFIFPRLVLPLAVAVTTFLLTTRMARGLLAWLRLRRHAVHHLRFSEQGFTWASALGSGRSTWSHTPVEERPDAIVLAGFALPRTAFQEGQIASILRFSLAAAKPKIVETPSSWQPARTNRSVVLLPLAVVLVFTAIAVHWGLHDPVQTPHDIEPILDESHTPAPPVVRAECELSPRVVPGAVLEEDMAACAGLAVALRRRPEFRPAVISHCVHVEDRNLDAAAVVWGTATMDMWLHVDAEWRLAGTLLAKAAAEEPACDGGIAISTAQMRVGGSPELLVTLDCVIQGVHQLHGAERRSRYLSACGLDDGAPYCWATLPIAESSYDPDRNECERWAYRVYSAAAGDPSVVWRGDDRLVFVRGPAPYIQPSLDIPSGGHSLEDLTRFNILSRQL